MAFSTITADIVLRNNCRRLTKTFTADCPIIRNDVGWRLVIQFGEHFVLRLSAASDEDKDKYGYWTLRGELGYLGANIHSIDFSGKIRIDYKNGGCVKYNIIAVKQDVRELDILIREYHDSVIEEAIRSLQDAMDIRRDYEIQKALDEQKRPYSLNEYMRDAMRTKGDFNLRDQLSDGGLGISGEAGEVSDLIKKHLFHGHPLEIIKLLKELGDVLWYIAEIADAAGFTLEDVARWNIEKLEERYPDGFSEEASINRKE